MRTNILLLILAALAVIPAYSQDTLRLTLPETIRMAQDQSPQAIAARHSFRAAYWNWRTFRAQQLPSLTFTSDPSLNRSISSVTLPDGGESFVHRNQLMVDAGLTINQNVALTGGSLFVKTALQRLDLFSEKTSSYNSTPVVVGYEQNLFGYNQFKWDRKIEPIRYSESRKNLMETLELVAAQATYQFFQLATAQTNWEIAQYNYANADTLYQYAQGRYNIGTITENEMLQLELNLLTEQTNRMNARIEMDNCIQALRSYLGINNSDELQVIIDGEIPHFNVRVDQALQLAYDNNPEPESLQRQRIESEYKVAVAKASRGFKADLYMQFGLTQTNEKLKEAYRNPLDQQLVSVGIRIPILDWGVGKGQVKVALSNRDKVYTDVEQSRNDFELNVIKMVKQFNLQADKVAIAQKTDQTAQRRNDVAQKLYLLGKSTILDLNASISEKDRARRDYITALYNYWNLYYGLRSMTGYDFEQDRELTVDYEQLMK
ncbi:TolC family protein [Parabacteroides sp.]